MNIIRLTLNRAVYALPCDVMRAQWVSGADGEGRWRGWERDMEEREGDVLGEGGGRIWL